MGRIKFAYFGYRDWAYKIFNSINKKGFELDSFTIKNSEYPSKENISIMDRAEIPKLNLNEYDALLFYGWSWILPEKIIEENTCVCLHPSPLPLYRGGSPIQHQIIDGNDESAVTLFKMGSGLDNGPIYYQKKISLEGNLSEIFDRIVNVGSELTLKLLQDFGEGTAKVYDQDESQATVYKRRKPEQSELKIEDLKNMSARQVHDFVRALQDPYPNAYILGKDNKKVFLTDTKLEKII